MTPFVRRPRLPAPLVLVALPALVFASSYCGGHHEPDGAGGGAAGGAAGGGPPITSYGAGGDAYVDAAKQANPFVDASADVGGGGACDDQKGDSSACDALGDAGPSCLTSALCAQAKTVAAPRTIGLTESCIASFAPGCTSADRGGCFVSSAALACTLAASGTAPCVDFAALCASGDPDDAATTCAAMASVLSADAATSIAQCLKNATSCSLDALNGCAAALFP